MFTVLAGMTGIILIGVFWRLLLGADRAGRIRTHLAGAVYQVFLPALVLHVLWRTPVSMDTLRIPVIAAGCVLGSMLAAFLIYGNGRLAQACIGRRSRPAIGALLLAASFGNFTYLGLPVLEQTFGHWARFVAIQFDLLASTPLLFTVGILLASHFGRDARRRHPFAELMTVPAFWAALVALGLSATGVPMPGWLERLLETLGQAVVPLMLLSVGMALSWQRGWLARLPLVAPALAIQLALMPVIAWVMTRAVGTPDQLTAPLVIEAAMPTMVLGLVLCDRYRLDASLYAEAVTLSTVISLASLPLWLHALSA